MSKLAEFKTKPLNLPRYFVLMKKHPNHTNNLFQNILAQIDEGYLPKKQDLDEFIEKAEELAISSTQVWLINFKIMLSVRTQIANLSQI